MADPIRTFFAFLMATVRCNSCINYADCIEDAVAMWLIALSVAGTNINAQDVPAIVKPYHYQVVDDPALQRQRVACGPNALYMFLKTHGIALPYEEVCTHLAMQAEGCTLLALRDAANQCGLSARVVKCSGADLKHLKLPAILHFHRSVYFGDNVKHYVLVTSVLDDRIEYVDGTSGWHLAITLKKFAAVSDGYVLERTGKSDLPWISWLIPITILMGGLASLRRCFTKRLRPALTKMALIAAVVGFGARGAAVGEPQTSDAPALSADAVWRAPAWDAINALDLYFRVINHAERRETIVRSLPEKQGVSLAKLAEVARDLGVPLQAVRPPIASLKHVAFPVIVHMFDDKEQNGGYYLLLGYNGNQVEVVNTAVATIEIYSADEFRRRWTGYALVREESKVSVVGTAGVTLLSLAGYLLFRCRRAGYTKQCANANGTRALTLDGDKL